MKNKQKMKFFCKKISESHMGMVSYVTDLGCATYIWWVLGGQLSLQVTVFWRCQLARSIIYSYLYHEKIRWLTANANGIIIMVPTNDYIILLTYLNLVDLLSLLRTQIFTFDTVLFNMI